MTQPKPKPTNRLDLVAFIAGIIGFVLLIAGIGVIYWPAALITAGVGLLAWSFMAARAVARANSATAREN